MNLLAVDTSSDNISLCIKYKGKIVTDFNQRKAQGASLLIGHIDRQLKKNGLNLKAIDSFILGAGPGSFTGLRVSFSLVKAFILALNKPAITLSSFSSCAQSLINKSKQIAVIADARRGLIYGASFTQRRGVLMREAKSKLYRLDEFIKNKSQYLFCTYDSDLRNKALELKPKMKFHPQDIYPKARNLLAAAELCYNKGKFTPIDKLNPVYLHPKTCQIRKK